VKEQHPVYTLVTLRIETDLFMKKALPPGVVSAILSLLLATAPTARAQYVISTFAGGIGPPTPVAGLTASIGRALSVAADAVGNVYFDSSLACVFKQDRSGIVTRVAGTCRAGFSGDGGLATEAQLGATLRVALDPAGNLYIADGANSRVRKVGANGIITTIAGSGQVVANGGDGGPAIRAQLVPTSVAFDAAGNIYIGERGGLREVLPDGTITSIAKGDIGFPYGVGGVAVDASGNIFVTEPERDNVRKISPARVITILPVGASYPQGLAIDSGGNLYIADHDNDRIAVVAPSGAVSTLAGVCHPPFPVTLCPSGFSGDGGPAVNATFALPYGVGVDPLGNVYVADTGNRRIRKISASRIIDTVAGNGTESYSGDGGPASKAQLGGPSGASFDSTGNLYFADAQNDRIRKIAPDGTITTIAGTGTPGFSGDGGPAINAQLNLSSAPDGQVGVTFDPAGNFYIADVGNHRIRKISSEGTITTAATATGPDVAADGSGNIYIADAGNVRKISPGGGIATLAQGSGPLALDSTGNLYFSDRSGFNYNIRKISPTGVQTLVVQTSFGPFVGTTVDSKGGVYFASTFLVFKVSSAPLPTIAGNGSLGYSGDGGQALSATLNVSGLAVDAAGNVYVMDAVDNAIRLLKPSQLLGPPPSISAVTNGASNRVGPLAAGEIVVVYGSNLGPTRLAQFGLNAAGLVGTSLAGTQVFFNTTPAPVIYTLAGQVAAIVPYSLPPGLPYQVTVSYQGQVSPPLTIPFAPAAPGLFTADSSGSGQAAAVNEDGSLNSANNPIGKGSVIVLYATGEGFTTPPGIDGKPATLPLPAPFLTVTATIGGQPALAQYAGGAPGFVAGLMQVNVVIPTNISPGPAVPVVLNVAGFQSQSGVSIAVGGN
jgi:uncharacterized protein (TIGR03437 family)